MTPSLISSFLDLLSVAEVRIVYLRIIGIVAGAVTAEVSNFASFSHTFVFGGVAEIGYPPVYDSVPA